MNQTDNSKSTASMGQRLEILMFILSSLLYACDASIPGSVALTVQLLEYNNPNGKLFGGAYCDPCIPILTSCVTCDLGLKVCIEDQKGSAKPTICSGHWFSTGQQTTDKDRFQLQPNHYYGSWFNPHTYRFYNDWKDSYLKILAIDFDNDAMEELVDSFLISLDSTVISLAHPIKEFTLPGRRTGTKPSVLALKISVSCPYGLRFTGGCKPEPPTTPTPTPHTTTFPHPPEITGDVEIGLELVYFTNPDDTLTVGDYCDLQIAPPSCDLSFKICMDETRGGSAISCSKEWIETGQVTSNNDTIRFFSHHFYGKWFNPTLFSHPHGWKSSYLKIVVSDVDLVGTQLIDFFTFELDTSVINVQHPSVFYKEVEGESATRNVPTLLSIRLTLSCPTGMAPDKKSCLPRPPTTPGHTTLPPTKSPPGLLGHDGAFFVLGEIPESDDYKLARNIAHLIYLTHILDTPYVHYDEEHIDVEVNLDYNFRTKSNDGEVTKVLFNARYKGKDEPKWISVDTFRRVFEQFTHKELETELSSGILPLALIEETDTNRYEKEWWRTYWWIFLIFGVVVLFLVLAGIISCVLCSRRSKDKRRKVHKEHRPQKVIYQIPRPSVASDTKIFRSIPE